MAFKKGNIPYNKPNPPLTIGEIKKRKGESDKRYRLKHPLTEDGKNRALGRIKIYKLRHPEKVKANKVISDAKRKALKKQLGGSFSLTEWDNLKIQYGLCCAICGQTEVTLIAEEGMGLTVDHIIPLSRWQEYIKTHPLPYRCGDIQNIQPLCIHCNCTKQAQLNEDFS